MVRRKMISASGSRCVNVESCLQNHESGAYDYCDRVDTDGRGPFYVSYIWTIIISRKIIWKRILFWLSNLQVMNAI